MTRVHELLAERGLRGLLQHAAALHRSAAAGVAGSLPTVRMEDGPPGEVAELDFGRLGLIADPESGRRRTVWALIVVWRYSRHCFVWPTTSQTAARGGRGPGGGLGVLRGRAPLPRDRQLPDRRGRGRRAAPAPHPGLPRVRPPARLHHRPRTRAPAPRQASGRAQRPVRARAPLQGRPVPRPRRAARRRPALVRSRWRGNASTGRPANARSRSSRRRSARLLAPWDGEPYEVARLADGEGPCRPPRRLPIRAVLGAVGALPAGAAGRGAARREAGAHLPPRRAAQGPPAPAPRRTRHRPATTTRPSSAPTRCARPSSCRRRAAELGEATGSLRRAALRGAAALGEAAAGPQAAAPGRALLPRPPRRRLPAGRSRSS